MSHIRSKNTTPEKQLFLELTHRGIRYTKHSKLPGTPDIAFRKQKLAIFVDGDFWHGYNWKVMGKAPPKGFWQIKITENIARDKRTKRKLSRLGWETLRFWEHEVSKSPKACADKIVRRLQKIESEPNL